MGIIESNEEKEIEGISKKIEKLRTLYFQYFMGIEKKEPYLLRNQLEKYFRISKLGDSKRVEIRFKYNSLVNRFRIYSSYWDRIIKAIEEGSYVRGIELGEKIEREIPQVEKRPYEDLYEEFIKNKKEIGESIEGFNYESFYNKLLKQKEEILQKYGWNSLTYEVQVKDNKVIIVAKKKKS